MSRLVSYPLSEIEAYDHKPFCPWLTLSTFHQIMLMGVTNIVYLNDKKIDKLVIVKKLGQK